MTAPVPADVISRLKSVLGDGGWSVDPDRLAPKLVEWRDRWSGTTPLLVLPRSTAEVAAVVGICAESGTAITPQGGNTGLVGGQIPDGEILLSLERMRAVREVNTADDVLIAEAGLTLAEAHEAAAAARRRFPLSLASEGSATIGGLVSTNAGGVAVLRYGTMRQLVLGLEAVLPNGEIWNGLKRLRKDNTGYDLKQLLIGAEGTLGVVTAAALKLFPLLVSRAVAIAGVASPAAAVALLGEAQEASGGAVESFELMSRLGIELALRHIPGSREPLESRPPWYVLIEIASGEPGAAEAAMERALEAGDGGTSLVSDAAIAQTGDAAKAFWALRENQSAAQKSEGAAWKHDVAVPVSRIAEFIETSRHGAAGALAGRADRRLRPRRRRQHPLRHPAGARRRCGHGVTTRCARHAAHVVHDIVMSLEGSISAEHGLGTMKTAEALGYKSAVEIEAQRAIRAALDPERIMNPRVLF